MEKIAAATSASKPSRGSTPRLWPSAARMNENSPICDEADRHRRRGAALGAAWRARSRAPTSGLRAAPRWRSRRAPAAGARARSPGRTACRPTRRTAPRRRRATAGMSPAACGLNSRLADHHAPRRTRRAPSTRRTPRPRRWRCRARRRRREREQLARARARHRSSSHGHHAAADDPAPAPTNAADLAERQRERHCRWTRGCPPAVAEHRQQHQHDDGEEVLDDQPADRDVPGGRVTGVAGPPARASAPRCWRPRAPARTPCRPPTLQPQPARDGRSRASVATALCATAPGTAMRRTAQQLLRDGSAGRRRTSAGSRRSRPAATRAADRPRSPACTARRGCRPAGSRRAATGRAAASASRTPARRRGRRRASR